MSDGPVPDSDYIVRLCKGTQVAEGEPQATAFMLRGGESALSVNWLEKLALPTRDEEIAEVQRLFSTFTIRATHRLAVLNVGEGRAAVATGTADQRDIPILHAPIEAPPDPSHSEIYNLPLTEDDMTAAEKLASVVCEIYPAKAGQ
ncbi:hypothetical protein FFI39_002530 [Janthinobacterium sp. KBS0711]|uniref:hypothetical protein n=1 Tax=Janthinobacterium sp. KBS0711 TaxID=1649647 RepID=UPI00110D269D|nr:hypothetical protein [Janthinobacterium sp. KBS0711]TSD69987.1 hypothetical protein FFI39_002530 [Janthinobacterium sp. KBS0711]